MVGCRRVRRDDTPPQGVRRSEAVDEIPISLRDLESRAPFGTDGWWSRWSFAWARVLRDETEGRVSAAVRRQATLTPEEQDSMLPHCLDGYVNFVYRALKADREGRVLERRLDAAESLPWMLDVVFGLCGRVRPYNKYLAWELREHPLGVAEWSADPFLRQIQDVLDGSPAALRAAFAVIERQCLEHDERRATRQLRDTLAGWDSELGLLRT